MNNSVQTPDFIVLHADDNVATALRDVRAGAAAIVAGPGGRMPDLIVRSDLKLGHKAALKPIAAGALAVKHGVPFGRVTTSIGAGEHVHVHNVISLSRETDIAPSESAHG